MRRQRRAREGQGKRKRENKRPILKKLCTALLRSFRGQHSEKMKGSARGNWDPQEGQQLFRPNPNGFLDRTTTLRQLLIGPDYFLVANHTCQFSPILPTNLYSSVNFRNSASIILNQRAQVFESLDLFDFHSCQFLSIVLCSYDHALRFGLVDLHSIVFH